ncbi:MAG: ABC transporter permease [Chloroflexi bacterium]|nr:ABC transporter permease [Chloroflexota bacterium]
MTTGGRSFAGLIALVARRDYIRTVRRRGFVVGTLLLPLGIGAFMLLSTILPGVAPGAGPNLPGGPSGSGDYVLLVVDESELGLQPRPDGTMPVELVSRDEGQARLEAGTADEFYLIPADYPADPTVRRIGNPTSGFDVASFQRQAGQQQELALLLRTTLLDDAAVPPEAAQRIVAPYSLETETTAGEPGAAGPSIAAFLVPFAFTMLFVMSIFITSGYLLQSVTEEKENRVVEIVLSSVPALPLMAGKILGLGAAGLTQVVFWVLSVLVVLAMLGDSGGSLEGVAIAPIAVLLGLVYFALGYLGYGAIFSAVGALAPGSREAQQYAGFFGFFAVVPLIFSSIFITDIGSPIVTILALIPFTTPAAMLMVVTLAPDIPWGLVVISIVSLGTFTVLATIASARVFRATLLLYGVRPGARAIVGAILARA